MPPDSLGEQPVAAVLEAMGARTPAPASAGNRRSGGPAGPWGPPRPAPASGAAAALTGALGAALAELAARFTDDEAGVERASALGRRLAALADEDVAAYTAFMQTRSAEARARIVAVPL